MKQNSQTKIPVQPEDQPVFTPLDHNGQRLCFLRSEVEFIPGYQHRRGPGIYGRVQINGKMYEVHGAPCSLDCYCDAVIKPVAETSNA